MEFFLRFALLLVLVTGSLSQWDRSDRDSRGRSWNPFQDSFDFSNIRGAPQGLGHAAPAFGSFSPGFGFDSGNNNNRFGSFGGNDNGGGGSRRKSASGGGTPNWNGNGGNSNGFSGDNNNNVFTWSAPSMTDFSSTFQNFKKQFATNFPWTGNTGGSDFGGFAPVTFGGFGSPGSSFGSNNEQPTDTGSPPSQPDTTTSTTTTTTTRTSSTSTASQASTNQQMIVTMRNCTQDGLVIGLTADANDMCGSIECQCFKGMYFCYSTCLPPPVNQTCDAVVSGNDNCPTYSNCGPLVNATAGASNIFRCDPRSQGIHPGVCWMYEILFGKLTEPLGYFESVAEPACSISTQCVCGSNGFVQPALLRQEDFKTPANNRVYPRTTPGRKGAFASS